MGEVLAILDNREKAALVWIAFAIVRALRSKDIRSSLASTLKILSSKFLLTLLVPMTGYVALIVFGLWKSDFWDFSLTKDTLIWFLGPGMLMVFNHEQARKDANYFKHTLLTILRLALILEFLVSFYVFPFIVELFLAPIMIVLGIMLVFTESKPEFAPVRKILEPLIAAIGLSLLTYALAMLIRDAGSFLTGDTLRSFALPIVLTLLFVPYICALAIYTGYEEIFVRIKIFIKDKELAGYTRRHVFRACLFRLGRINRFMSEYCKRLPTVNSKSDAIKLFTDFESH